MSSSEKNERNEEHDKPQKKESITNVPGKKKRLENMLGVRNVPIIVEEVVTSMVGDSVVTFLDLAATFSALVSACRTSLLFMATIWCPSIFDAVTTGTL